MNWAFEQAYLPLHLVSSFPAVLRSIYATGAIAGVEETKEQPKAPLHPTDKAMNSNTHLLSGPWGHEILNYSSSELATTAFLQ